MRGRMACRYLIMNRAFSMTKANTTSRLFLALRPEPPIQYVIERWREEWTLPSTASLVAQESIHLDVTFPWRRAQSPFSRIGAGINSSR